MPFEYTPPLAVSGYALETTDAISALLCQVTGVLERHDPKAEPTGEEWRALDIQMYAVPGLRRALAAIDRIVTHKSVPRDQPSALAMEMAEAEAKALDAEWGPKEREALGSLIAA